MLTHLTLKNFKPIRHIDLELEPMSVFIGPNDSGKSSILQAVRYASQIASRRRIEEIFNGIHHLDHLQNKSGSGPICYKLSGYFPNIESFQWSFELSAVKTKLGISKESWRTRTNQLQSARGRSFVTQLPEWLARFIQSAAYLHIDPNRLKQDSYSEEDTPQLEYGGTGLPSVLSAMQGLERDKFDELEKRFTEIVPTVKRILVGPIPVYINETETIRIDDEEIPRSKRRRYMGHRLYFDTVSGDRIPASHMSDGSMVILGYLAALLGDRRPNLILLEEPENGIHPKALEPFMDFIRDCMERDNIQVMMTSHSPYLVDHLRPEETFLTRRSEFTEIARLDKLPDIEHWVNNLSTGELWTMGGEDELIRRIIGKKAGNV